MLRLSVSSERPFAAGDEFGLAINEECGHVGIFLSETESVVKQLHLGGHNRLNFEPISSEDFFAWIVPSETVRLRAKYIATLCRLVHRRFQDQKFPYGFSCPDGAIARTGHLSPGCVGLTCASFVLAIMHAAGAQLVDYSSWQLNPEDHDWQIDYLKRYMRAPAEHIGKVEAELPSIRYRPDQVAGAACADSAPVKRPEADALALEIRKFISSRPDRVEPPKGKIPPGNGQPESAP